MGPPSKSSHDAAQSNHDRAEAAGCGKGGTYTGKGFKWLVPPTPMPEVPMSLMDRLQRPQLAILAQSHGGKFLGAPEAAVREAVEWGAGVKGGKSSTRLLSSCGRITLVVAVRRRLQRRHSRQPEVSQQARQLLGARKRR